MNESIDAFEQAVRELRDANDEIQAKQENKHDEQRREAAAAVSGSR